ncbi:flavodoxin-dependent (E)-4-hydroxy-3-methylbut-2-enyl-diphosphate synthase [Prolixibacter bellariivorans]|uniref:flavodoxin-dependent (E)-4-hydroxy-3-methylbut-2-enyl-diphosphate synthase n=1 Tax=Prolixibacter bellariivorans TaxID=314319 RepID=UPI000684C725|nr:flavodoxin-dependent (E)-4-hydroxy-3-methylbut-2-enyl-diphosphate synthase [Prolixibacter bellariivorans]
MKDQNFNFVNSLFRYERQKTATVQVGEVKVGGEYPIRLQSMTDTDTNDTDATVEQIIRIIKAGADFVRMAVQGLREAENLKSIRAELDKRGYAAIPLVADIHFSPQAAETAIKYVKKVRINPGNFYDPRAKFQKVDYTDDEYRDELAGIEERFIPFLKACAERGTALRIGANHALFPTGL